jgi:hypothetical protein
VVAYLFDPLAVRYGDFFEVRRVNDQLAAVSDNRFQLIHALAGDP